MKKTYAIIGLAFHALYSVLMLLSFVDYPYSGRGVGLAFAFWIYAMIVVIPCIVFYAIDAVLHMKRIFDVKVIAVAVGIPLYVFVGASADLIRGVLWNCYFLGLFVMEMVFLLRKGTK